MNLPGTVYIAAIVAITAWLQSSFPEQWWIGGAVIVLGAVAKLIEIYMTPEPPTDTERLMSPKPPPSKMSRFLLGG